MTSTSGITSVAPSVPATQVTAALTAQASPAATSTKALAQSQTVSISPRIIDNASAGVIVTQYLDSTGKVVSQNPSSTVVAYLRAGLTAQGLSKHTPPISGKTETTGTFA